jgi:two-component system chemotaxis response regulator CheB
VEVSGTASNGKLALEAMEKSPADLVLIDLEMPVMGGLEVLPELRQKYPKSKVVLISSASQSSTDLTLQALQAGALDFIQKPSQGSLNDNLEALRQKLQAIIKTCLENKLPTHRPITPTKPVAVTHNRSSVEKIDVVVIGVSTGGPNALAEVIPKLPATFEAPVLIVQHMPAMFTESLANMLNKKSALHVKEAQQDEPIQAGTIYIAPGGRHMKVGFNVYKQPIVLLTDTEPVNSCRPSVDVLFQSIPPVYGNRVLSVIMTGMGNDGLNGVRELKVLGCHSITQTANTCVVYGMPKAVDDENLSDEKVDLPDLAGRITELVRKHR